MAIFHLPPVQSTGGAQPYGNIAKFRDESGQVVNTPPFRYGGPVAVVAAIIATLQPNPWVYGYNGTGAGAQPYGPRQLNPAIIAVPEDNPPFDYDGPVAGQAEVIGLWQPDPYLYQFFGGRQPFAPSRLNPTALDVEVNNPPFNPRAAQQKATPVAIAQPDPWVYNFIGSQPYGHILLVVFRPEAPPVDSRGAAIRASIVTASQPNPWVYNFQGRQPYAPKQNSPGIPGMSGDFPPPDSRFRVIYAELVDLNQPPRWPYVFVGGPQPYAPTPLNPEFEGIPIPPPGSGKRKGFPSYTPQPDYDAPRTAKKFRPVWDKPRPADPAPAVVGPPPLPPASLFAAAQPAAPAPLDVRALPMPGRELVPGDPLGLSRRMAEAQDLNDALAVLKKLGLMGDI